MLERSVLEENVILKAKIHHLYNLNKTSLEGGKVTW